MSANKTIIITFDSAQQAMMAESILEQSSIAVTLIVTPRTVTSNCGFSLSVVVETAESLETTLQKNSVPYKELFIKDIREGVPYYEKY